MNMGYISDTARNRTHNLFRPKREPIPLGHSDGHFQAFFGHFYSIKTYSDNSINNLFLFQQLMPIYCSIAYPLLWPSGSGFTLDGTGCEFDSWQCRIPCSLNQYLGPFEILWVHMVSHKNCVKNDSETTVMVFQGHFLYLSQKLVPLAVQSCQKNLKWTRRDLNDIHHEISW